MGGCCGNFLPNGLKKGIGADARLLRKGMGKDKETMPIAPLPASLLRTRKGDRELRRWPDIQGEQSTRGRFVETLCRCREAGAGLIDAIRKLMEKKTGFGRKISFFRAAGQEMEQGAANNGIYGRRFLMRHIDRTNSASPPLSGQNGPAPEQASASAQIPCAHAPGSTASPEKPDAAKQAARKRRRAKFRPHRLRFADLLLRFFAVGLPAACLFSACPFLIARAGLFFFAAGCRSHCSYSRSAPGRTSRKCWGRASCCFRPRLCGHAGHIPCKQSSLRPRGQPSWGAGSRKGYAFVCGAERIAIPRKHSPQAQWT